RARRRPAKSGPARARSSCQPRWPANPLADQAANQGRLLLQVPGSEEALRDPLPGGLAQLLRRGGIAEHAADGPPKLVDVAGIVDQHAAATILDLVPDASDAARDHRLPLPHRLGDGEAEALRKALLDDDPRLPLDGVHDDSVLLLVVHR